MLRRRGFTLIELLVVIAIIAVLAAILFPVFAGLKERGQMTKCMSNMRQLAAAMLRYVDDANGALPGAGNGAWSRSNTTCWRTAIQPYCKNRGIFMCTSRTARWRRNVDAADLEFVHYGLGMGLTHARCANPGFITKTVWDMFGFTFLAKVQLPSKTIMVSENGDGDWSGEPMTDYSPYWQSGTNAPGGFFAYHMRKDGVGLDYNGGGNFVFCDSHVKFLPVNVSEGIDTTVNPPVKRFTYWVADKSFYLPPLPVRP